MVLMFNGASGRWFASPLDFVQQSGYLALTLASMFVGGVLGSELRASLGSVSGRGTHLTLAAAFLITLYFLGFVDFGIFSGPERWNWLWFPCLGFLGIATSFITRS